MKKQTLTSFEIQAIDRSIKNDRKLLQGCEDKYRSDIIHRIKKQSSLLKRLKIGDN